MATTKNTYTGNGSTTNYPFTFPYLDVRDIVVTVNDVVQSIPSDYILGSPTNISFVSPPANGTEIIIRRVTSDDDIAAVFFPGSSIRARDLNDNFQQILYVSQETQTRADESESNSDAAEESARLAQLAAEAAEESANQAAADAAEANDRAASAEASANAAEIAAEAAQDAAEGVAGEADEALATANEALATANAADTKADTALSNSSQALSAANQAVSTANNANANANLAVSVANEASSNIDQALETADRAEDKADTAILIATNALAIADEVSQQGEPFGGLYNITPGDPGSKVIDLGDLSDIDDSGHFPNEDSTISKYTCSKGTGTYNLGVVA